MSYCMRAALGISGGYLFVAVSDSLVRLWIPINSTRCILYLWLYCMFWALPPCAPLWARLGGVSCASPEPALRLSARQIIFMSSSLIPVADVVWSAPCFMCSVWGFLHGFNLSLPLAWCWFSYHSGGVISSSPLFDPATSPSTNSRACVDRGCSGSCVYSNH